MNEWSELAEHVAATYVPWSPGPAGPPSLKVVVALDEGRSQVVVLSPLEMDDGVWVELFTPVAQEHEIDGRSLLLQNCKITVGAFALTEAGMIVFRYCLPLSDLTAGMLDTAVGIVADYADRVEMIATAGEDVF